MHWIKNKKILDMIEAQLTDDLVGHGIMNLDRVKFDWSEAVGEGGWQEYEDGHIESFSDVRVETQEDCKISGWIDFILDSEDVLHYFWEKITLKINSTAERQDVYNIIGHRGIPKHIWHKLPEIDQKKYKPIESGKVI